MTSDTLKQPMLRRAFAVCKSNFLFVVLFSSFINLLMFVARFT